MEIRAKIASLGCAVTIATTLAVIGVVLIQKKHLQGQLQDVVIQQTHEEADKVTRAVLLVCEASEARTQRRLSHNLIVAKECMEQIGPLNFSTETVQWKAVNQLSKAETVVALPKLLLGKTWLGQNSSTNTPSPMVDTVTRFTRDYVTVFQRMNDDGDMMRVCTSVINASGKRAIGTYIPRRSPDGTESAVIKTILQGDTYKGRAFVVSEWHAAVYEPLWNENHSRIVGMLYVGVSMGNIDAELRQVVTKASVGKTGYAYVLGAKGEYQGKYIISKNAERDGESIWNVRDAGGRFVIQSIINKALQAPAGSLVSERYQWQNPGESKPRTKFVAATYFEPWDWMLAVGTYEDDYDNVNRTVAAALTRMTSWIALVALVAVLLAALASYMLAHGIARPIRLLVQRLTAAAEQLRSASGQFSSASQHLTDGANQQAASLQQSRTSLEEISQVTQRNSQDASHVKELAEQARHAAESGTSNVQQMSGAMDEIQASAAKIAEILKSVDAIAFRTNLLALNAAIEAAHAGDAGAGFAVVAEDVRRLAQRSAEAARDMAGKIDDTLKKTERGVRLTHDVAVVLEQIVSQVRKVDELAAGVANASQEQSRGIREVSTAVTEMDDVTQHNAANAQETASAAQELNSQAETLRSAVSDLTQLAGGGVKQEALSASRPRATQASPRSSRKPEVVPDRELLSMLSRRM